MYGLLIKLMLFTTLLQLGISIADFKNCKSGQCLQQIGKGSRDILKINWKPISIFPEEAKRFR